MSRAQLTQLGLDRHAIEQRLRRGRLHRVRRGIYAVGRPGVDRYGRWMAALLACSDGAALGHRSAAALWGIEREGAPIDVAVPAGRRCRLPGIRPHRRELDDTEFRVKHGLRLTSPATTLIDLATCIGEARLERAMNEADSKELVTPDGLLEAADAAGPRHGARTVRAVLTQHGLIYTQTRFEQRLLSLVRKARLPLPLTQQWLCGHKVDFFWPDSKLVVEADSLTYHRTPSRQAKDAARDQALTLAGYTAIRVTHRQLRDQPDLVTHLLTQLVYASA